MIYIVFITLFFKGRTAGRFSLFWKKKIVKQKSAPEFPYLPESARPSLTYRILAVLPQRVAAHMHLLSQATNKNHVECSERG